MKFKITSIFLSVFTIALYADQVHAGEQAVVQNQTFFEKHISVPMQKSALFLKQRKELYPELAKESLSVLARHAYHDMQFICQSLPWPIKYYFSYKATNMFMGLSKKIMINFLTQKEQEIIRSVSQNPIGVIAYVNKSEENSWAVFQTEGKLITFILSKTILNYVLQHKIMKIKPDSKKGTWLLVIISLMN